jgi:hypothetical protein
VTFLRRSVVIGVGVLPLVVDVITMRGLMRGGETP